VSTIWLRNDGLTQGPMDEEEARRRFKAGDLAASTMSWRSGEPGWRSLGRRWGAPQRGQGWHFLSWSLLLCGVALLLGWGELWEARMPLDEQAGPKMMLGGAILAALLAAGGASYVLATWLRRRTLTPAAVHVLLLVVLSIALALPQQHLRADGLALMHASPNAGVQLSADGSRLEISGEIGPRLLADVQQAYADQPGVRLLVLDSPGGLMVQAERVGRWISAQKVPVLIESECSSACVLLWAASPDRRMLPSARLGLHRSSNRMDLPSSALRESIENADIRYRQLLREAGFGQELLEIHERTGAGDMHWLSSAELADHEVELTVVDAAGRPVPDSRLRWESLIARLGQGDPLAVLMTAVGEHLPEQMDTHASRLYWSADNGNARVFQHHRDAMLVEVKRQALLRARDEAILSWWEPERAMYAEAFASRDARRCAALAGDTQTIEPSLAKDLQSKYWLRIADLVNTLPDAPTAQAVDPARLFRDGQAYSRLMQRAYLDMAGEPARGADAWTSLQRCAFIASVHQHLQKLPGSTRASMVRYAELQ
jgi:hypothetical protein